jgi:hypothetical protein
MADDDLLSGVDHWQPGPLDIVEREDPPDAGQRVPVRQHVADLNSQARTVPGQTADGLGRVAAAVRVAPDKHFDPDAPSRARLRCPARFNQRTEWARQKGDRKESDPQDRRA